MERDRLQGGVCTEPWRKVIVNCQRQWGSWQVSWGRSEKMHRRWNCTACSGNSKYSNGIRIPVRSSPEAPPLSTWLNVHFPECAFPGAWSPWRADHFIFFENVLPQSRVRHYPIGNIPHKYMFTQKHKNVSTKYRDKWQKHSPFVCL